MIAYVLFGETNIGRKRLARYHEVSDRIRGQVAPELRKGQFDEVKAPHRHLFRLGQSVNGLGPFGGSRGEVMADTDATFDALVADIDAARESVHLMFYIWLDDRNGLRVAEAAGRAARRGVAVRVMADDIGSRSFIRSAHWRDMQAEGGRCRRTRPSRELYIFLHPVRGRVDLRNTARWS